MQETNSVYVSEVENIVNERQSDYGDFKASHENIADLWSAWGFRTGKLLKGFTGADVAMMMHLMKISRQAHRDKDDNLLDAEAYWEFYKELK